MTGIIRGDTIGIQLRNLSDTMLSSWIELLFINLDFKAISGQLLPTRGIKWIINQTSHMMQHLGRTRIDCHITHGTGR